jgi:hypothetical protein
MVHLAKQSGKFRVLPDRYALGIADKPNELGVGFGTRTRRNQVRQWMASVDFSPEKDNLLASIYSCPAKVAYSTPRCDTISGELHGGKCGPLQAQCA